MNNEGGFEDADRFLFEEPGSHYQKRNDLLRDKTYAFALRCVKLAQFLQKDDRFSSNAIENPAPKQRELILSKQVLRSGTAIGALLREGRFAQSRADFISKFHIALKEASETEYWLDLLKDGGYVEERIHQSMQTDLEEILKLLIASIKTARDNG